MEITNNLVAVITSEYPKCEEIKISREEVIQICKKCGHSCKAENLDKVDCLIAYLTISLKGQEKNNEFVTVFTSDFPSSPEIKIEREKLIQLCKNDCGMCSYAKDFNKVDCVLAYSKISPE